MRRRVYSCPSEIVLPQIENVIDQVDQLGTSSGNAYA